MHSYASTQLNLPSAVAAEVLALAHRIPDAVLAEKGRETDPHVTVLYGIKVDDPAAVAAVANATAPVEIRLGRTAIFPATEERQSDVVVVLVESPDLHRLNASLASAVPHDVTHADYTPHVTLAYLKPGEGEKFAGMEELVGVTAVIDRIRFSNREELVIDLPFKSAMASELPSGELLKRMTARRNGFGRYTCPKCGKSEAYSGDRATGDRFKGSAKCEACGEGFSVIGMTPIDSESVGFRRADEYFAGKDGKQSGKQSSGQGSTVDKNGESGRWVTIHGEHGSHPVFIRDSAGHVPKRVKSANEKRFTRAEIERTLVDHYHAMGGGWQPEHDAMLEASGGQGDSAWTFHKKLPEEIKHFRAGRPELRALFQVTDDATKSYGADAFGMYGDKYFDLAELKAGSPVRLAVEFAKNHPDPELQLLAHTHANLPRDAAGSKAAATRMRNKAAKLAKSTDPDKIKERARLEKQAKRLEEEAAEAKPLHRLDAGGLRVGDQFTIGGDHFHVAEDEHGYRVLRHGQDIEIELHDGLEVPHDKGSFKAGKQAKSDAAEPARSGASRAGLPRKPDDDIPFSRGGGRRFDVKRGVWTAPSSRWFDVEKGIWCFARGGGAGQGHLFGGSQGGGGAGGGQRHLFDPSSGYWRTIHGAKVHFDGQGHVDKGPGGLVSRQEEATPRKPVRAYHGTDATVTRFDTTRGSSESRLGPGAYFAFEKEVARGWAKERGKGRVYEVDLHHSNPFDVQDGTKLAPGAAEAINAAATRLGKAGIPAGFETGSAQAAYKALTTANGYDKAEVRAILEGAGFDAISDAKEIAVFDADKIKILGSSSPTPRDAARTATKAALADPDYAYARASAVPNAGEDLARSARHARNAWRGLAQAEQDGTAAASVTRDGLLRNEPHGLAATMTPASALSHLAAHLTLQALPDSPESKYISWDKVSTPESRRREFYEVFGNLKEVAESAAQATNDPNEVLRKLSEAVRSEILRLRGQKDFTSLGAATATNPRNAVANSLVATLKRTSPNRYRVGGTSVAGRVREFQQRLEKAYGAGAIGDKVQHHVLDVMEGQSFNKTFDTVTNRKQQFHSADVYVKHAERTGGPSVDAATAQKATDYLLNSVKMRGLQHGNSVSDEERLHHLKFTAESFADLADVTGLPLEAISHDGALGIAFGARGKGRALAHYEPDLQVINLTRTGGVGSLAHEWWHSLDHQASRKHMGRSMSYGTRAYGGVGNDVGKAFRELAEHPAMQRFNRRVRQTIRDMERQGQSVYRDVGYWASPEELSARAFEKWTDHRLAGEGRKNTYLAGAENHPLWPTTEEVKELSPAFERVFAAVKAARSATPALSLSRAPFDPTQGRWVTIRGRPVFIEGAPRPRGLFEHHGAEGGGPGASNPSGTQANRVNEHKDLFGQDRPVGRHEGLFGETSMKPAPAVEAAPKSDRLGSASANDPRHTGELFGDKAKPAQGSDPKGAKPAQGKPQSDMRSGETPRDAARRITQELIKSEGLSYREAWLEANRRITRTMYGASTPGPEPLPPADLTHQWREFVRHASDLELRNYELGGVGFGVRAEHKPAAIMAAKEERLARVQGRSTEPADDFRARPRRPDAPNIGTHAHEVIAPDGRVVGIHPDAEAANAHVERLGRKHAPKHAKAEVDQVRAALAAEGHSPIRLGDDGTPGFVVRPRDDGDGVDVFHGFGGGPMSVNESWAKSDQYERALHQAGYEVRRRTDSTTLHVRGHADAVKPKQATTPAQGTPGQSGTQGASPAQAQPAAPSPGNWFDQEEPAAKQALGQEIDTKRSALSKERAAAWLIQHKAKLEAKAKAKAPVTQNWDDFAKHATDETLHQVTSGMRWGGDRLSHPPEAKAAASRELTQRRAGKSRGPHTGGVHIRAESADGKTVTGYAIHLANTTSDSGRRGRTTFRDGRKVSSHATLAEAQAELKRIHAMQARSISTMSTGALINEGRALLNQADTHLDQFSAERHAEITKALRARPGVNRFWDAQERSDLSARYSAWQEHRQAEQARQMAAEREAQAAREAVEAPARAAKEVRAKQAAWEALAYVSDYLRDAWAKRNPGKELPPKKERPAEATGTHAPGSAPSSTRHREPDPADEIPFSRKAAANEPAASAA